MVCVGKGGGGRKLSRDSTFYKGSGTSPTIFNVMVLVQHMINNMGNTQHGYKYEIVRMKGDTHTSIIL